MRGLPRGLHVHVSMHVDALSVAPWRITQYVSFGLPDKHVARPGAVIKVAQREWLSCQDSMTMWPSDLRCWLQAPVRKGVGSTPQLFEDATKSFHT